MQVNSYRSGIAEHQTASETNLVKTQLLHSDQEVKDAETKLVVTPFVRGLILLFVFLALTFIVHSSSVQIAFGSGRNTKIDKVDHQINVESMHDMTNNFGPGAQK